VDFSHMDVERGCCKLLMVCGIPPLLIVDI
jgi:hypothetical protein